MGGGQGRREGIKNKEKFWKRENALFSSSLAGQKYIWHIQGIPCVASFTTIPHVAHFTTIPHMDGFTSSKKAKSYRPILDIEGLVTWSQDNDESYEVKLEGDH